MKYNNLLQLSEKFADYAADYLRKPIGKFSIDERMLMQNNIFPIQLMRGKKITSHLGNGKFSNTYRVIYKGKEMVAKMTKDAPSTESAVKLSEMKKVVPSKFKKHIMTIYDQFEDKENGVYIVLAELLEPLNPHLLDTIIGKNSKPILFPLIDLGMIDQVVQNLFGLKNSNEFKELLGIRFSNFVSKLSISVQKIFKQYEGKAKRQNILDKMSSEFVKELNSIFADRYFSKFYKENKESIDYFIPKIELSFYGFITGIFDNKKYDPKDRSVSKYINKFPENIELYDKTVSRYGINVFEHMPETKSLMEFLKYLKQVFGIEFYDLHRGNLMQRPGTKDIVISDPGYFQII